MAQNYVLLERIELNASAASVTFSNIPQTGYTDLKIVISARGDYADTSAGGYLRFNGSTSGYSARLLYGNGSSAASASTSLGYLTWANDIPSATATANTFGNGEIYIPNYAGSQYKSLSVDNVVELNAATANYLMLNAGLWSNTAAITSIQIYPSTGNYVAGSTFSLYGIAQVGTTPVVAPKADGGNIIATDGTYWYHAFLSNGTFTPQVGLTCDALVVAGGGGGGYQRGGGGGAGGYLTFTSQALSSSQTITVGAGGAGATDYVVAPNGNDSQIGSLTLVKGGGGGGQGSNDGVAGAAGGSAGGSGMNINGTTIITNPSVSGQGNAGGSGGGSSNNYAGGGGGGAGAVGGNANPSTGGVGLYNAISGGSVTGVGQLSSGNYYFAGGGGGGREYTTSSGGIGGGGAGSGGSGGGAGTTNTGGGGGGGAFYGFPLNPAAYGGAGGSGIVIIRYPVAS